MSHVDSAPTGLIFRSKWVPNWEVGPEGVAGFLEVDYYYVTLVPNRQYALYATYYLHHKSDLVLEFCRTLVILKNVE